MGAALLKYQGCLLGLAIGDALGAPIEFMDMSGIINEFGAGGMKDLYPWYGFKAGTYTDDTQMSIATALGCLQARQSGLDPVDEVLKAYLQWMESQNCNGQRRAPGHTCLTALHIRRTTCTHSKINDSKGCGGVMRAAPAGLAYPPGEAFICGADFARLTHDHPSGYLSAGVLADITARLVQDNSLEEALDSSMEILRHHNGSREILLKLYLSRKLADSELSAADSINRLGEGWVAEEALAIALYCAIKFPSDFSLGVSAAVNHPGDSDSTGCITGALLGTKMGIEAIPKKWIEMIENRDKLFQLAGYMWKAFYQKQTLDDMDFSYAPYTSEERSDQ